MRNGGPTGTDRNEMEGRVNSEPCIVAALFVHAPNNHQERNRCCLKKHKQKKVKHFYST